MNTRQRLSLSFPELRYSFEFNSNLPTFDEVWSTAASLFKWRFGHCRRHCCRVSSQVSARLTTGCYTHIVSPKHRPRIKWHWFVRKEKREGVTFPRSSLCFLFVCFLHTTACYLLLLFFPMDKTLRQQAPFRESTLTYQFGTQNDICYLPKIKRAVVNFLTLRITKRAFCWKKPLNGCLIYDVCLCKQDRFNRYCMQQSYS